MKPLLPIALFLATALGSASVAQEIEFTRAHELVRSYCVECHNPADEKGGLDLAVLESEADFLSKPILLEDLEWVVAEKEMPPPKAEKQPTADERRELVAWFQQELMKIQNAMPEDPGQVPMPRVSSKEFDYIIEDLTGREYGLSQFLTSDTAAGEGFYNVGAGQQLSVGQFESFMNVGKVLMDNARYVPGMGVWWMANPKPPLESDDELKEFMGEELYDLVERQVLPDVIKAHVREVRRETSFKNFGPYLHAAWMFRYRNALGLSGATVDSLAGEIYQPSLFPSALHKTVAILGRDRETPEVLEWRENPFMAEIVERWLALPPPDGRDDSTAQEKIAAIEQWVDLASDTVDSGGAHWGEEQPIEIAPVDKPERQQRRGYYHRGKGYLKIDATQAMDNTVFLAATGRTFPSSFDPTVLWGGGTVTMKDGRNIPWREAGVRVVADNGGPLRFEKKDGIDEPVIARPTPSVIAVVLPAGAKTFEINAMYDPSESGHTRLLRVRPFDTSPDISDLDVFYRSAAIGSDLKDPGVAEAFRSAKQVRGFLSDSWYHYRFSLDDLLAQESEAVRNYMGTDLVERAEDRRNYWGNLYTIPLPSMEERIDRDVSASLVRHYRELHEAIRAAANAQNRSDQEAVAEKRRVLEDFAADAWRGTATPAEIDGLMNLYRAEREDGTPTEQALETAMRTITLSPKFLYRFTESQRSEDPYPLQPRELATRLASVLWSGLPDAKLYAAADSGSLRNPEVLEAHIDRMLADPKADRFIEEFFGRWLHFAEFDTFSGPDQEKFEEWDKELARLMHAETTNFIQYLVREDRPITDLFYADYTFLNQRLAEHYGIDGVRGKDMRLVQLEDSYRGGILGMGAFLVKTSSPLRTSPVHRGLWLYEDVLDLPVPEPPPVPLLSDEGVDEEGRGIVEQLRQHRNDPACYSCHDRFDPMGVALENFDPVGRWRTKIEDKADVISQGLFRSGETIDGVDGLRDYLSEQEDTLLEAFATKLLGYSLGRSVLPTDNPTLNAMVDAMRANGLSPRAAIHIALTSPQFLQRRDANLASH